MSNIDQIDHGRSVLQVRSLRAAELQDLIHVTSNTKYLSQSDDTLRTEVYLVLNDSPRTCSLMHAIDRKLKFGAKNQRGLLRRLSP